VSSERIGEITHAHDERDAPIMSPRGRCGRATPELHVGSGDGWRHLPGGSWMAGALQVGLEPGEDGLHSLLTLQQDEAVGLPREDLQTLGIAGLRVQVDGEFGIAQRLVR